MSDADNVEVLDPLRLPSWDGWLDAWEDATVFHSSAWARTLVESYGFRPAYAVVRDADGELRGALPMMEVPGIGARRRGVGLPFSDTCLPLVRDARDLDLLHEGLVRHGRMHGWRSIEFRGPVASDRGVQPALSFYVHEVNLRGSEEDVWHRCRPSVRRAVRKAREGGLSVRHGCDDAMLEIFYSLFAITRRKHGLPPPPRTFFRALQQHLLAPGWGTVVSAWSGDRPAAAAVFLRWGTHGLFKYGASDPDCLEHRPNDLVMEEGYRWCREQGCVDVSLGKTRCVQEGLRHFKLGWGGVERTWDYFLQDLPSGQFVQMKDAVEGWYTNVFRRLPLPMLEWAGRLLYRQAA